MFATERIDSEYSQKYLRWMRVNIVKVTFTIMIQGKSGGKRLPQGHDFVTEQELHTLELRGS